MILLTVFQMFVDYFKSEFARMEGQLASKTTRISGVLIIHPAGRALTSDWSVNNFMGNFQSEFLSKTLKLNMYQSEMSALPAGCITLKNSSET